MENRKLIYGLIVAVLFFNAFLAGYLLNSAGLRRAEISLGTGGVLDKFSQNPKPGTNNNPTSTIKELKNLSRREAVSVTTSADGNNILYYEKNTGKVFEANLDTAQEGIVSATILPNFIKTIWAPNKKEVVSLFYTPQGNEFKYYNYNTKRSVGLALNISSVVFSPDSSQIAYFETNKDGGAIFISQPDGSIGKKILNTRISNLELSWPKNDLLAFKTRDDYSGNWSVFTLSKDGALVKLLESENGLENKWSLDGSKLLFSHIDENGVKVLSIKNLDSGEEIKLSPVITASKCSWSIDNKTIVCAIAKPLNSLREELFEINTEDKSQKLIASPEKDINVSDIFLSSLENYIIIQNAIDGELYYIQR